MGKYRPTPAAKRSRNNNNKKKPKTAWCYIDLVPPTLVALFSSHSVVLASLHLDSRVLRSSMRLQLQVCWGSLELLALIWTMNPCSLLATSIQFYFAHFKNIQLIVVEFPQQLRDSFALVEGMHSPEKPKTLLSSSSGPCFRFTLRFDPNSILICPLIIVLQLWGDFLTCVYSVRLKDFW